MYRGLLEEMNGGAFDPKIVLHGPEIGVTQTSEQALAFQIQRFAVPIFRL